MIQIALQEFYQTTKRGRDSSPHAKSPVNLIPKLKKIVWEKKITSHSTCKMKLPSTMLKKMLSNQIYKYIKKMINYDQVGFIIEMQGWFYIRKFLNVIHQIDRFLKINKWDLLNTYRKKVFDTI